MLFKQNVLDGIRDGHVTLAFRRWRRPTVRSGGTLLTAIGQLEIRAVTRIDETSISEDDAVRAGLASRAVLLDELRTSDAGDVYRIELGALREDPRDSLKTRRPNAADLADTLARLARLDRASSSGPWTMRALALIRDRPGVRAGDLAAAMQMEKEPFKVNVRKLKQLGLTESLDVGYRLSLRGTIVLANMPAGSEA